MCSYRNIYFGGIHTQLDNAIGIVIQCLYIVMISIFTQYVSTMKIIGGHNNVIKTKRQMLSICRNMCIICFIPS